MGPLLEGLQGEWKGHTSTWPLPSIGSDFEVQHGHISSNKWSQRWLIWSFARCSNRAENWGVRGWASDCFCFDQRVHTRDHRRGSRKVVGHRSGNSEVNHQGHNASRCMDNGQASGKKVSNKKKSVEVSDVELPHLFWHDVSKSSVSSENGLHTSLHRYTWLGPLSSHEIQVRSWWILESLCRRKSMDTKDNNHQWSHGGEGQKLES